jgi:hypothetical protein
MQDMQELQQQQEESSDSDSEVRAVHRQCNEQWGRPCSAVHVAAAS